MRKTKEPHLVDIYAGRQLRLARRQANMSQEALGMQLTHPVSFQQIQKYECADNRLSASTLWEFCDILSLPPAHFFPKIDKNVANETALLLSFRKLPKDKQNALLVLVDAH